MLQRTSRRPIYTQLVTPIANREQYACHACASRACRARLPSRVTVRSKSDYFQARAAPTTNDRPKDRRPLLATQQNLYQQGLQRGFDEGNLRSILTDPVGPFKDPDGFIKFVEEYERESARSRRADGSSDIDILALARQHGISPHEVWKAGLWFRQAASKLNRRVGLRFLTALSDCGFLQATALIVTDALHRSETEPQIWLNSRVARARAQLRAAIRNPDSTQIKFQALVLEGRIAKSLKDEDRAIELLTKAIPGAIAAPEVLTQALDIYEQYGLATPWRDLIQIYQERVTQKRHSKNLAQNYQMLNKYITIGCEQDDPLAYWAAAKYYRSLTKDGNHIPTSRWLYNTLKAAASGHLEAAFELGRFYQDSGWRYIEDDVPEHLKPTPFDRGPPPTTAQSPEPLPGLSAFFSGETFKSKAREPHEELFYDATFPAKAVDRVRLAWEWLDICFARNYAPAFLIAAGICLDKTLWYKANAPKCALELHDDRYAFQYAAGSESAEEKNPFYDPDRAKICLRAVFHAWDCKQLVAARRRKITLQRQRDGLTRISEFALDTWVWEQLEEEAPDRAKYFKDTDAWGLYEPMLDELYNKAAVLCKKHKLVIYNDSGTLVYDGRFG